MSVDHGSETGTETPPAFRPGLSWRAGAAAGAAATVVMGLVISATNLSTLQVAIAGLYGFEGSLVAGWAAHLAHGTVFGVVFAAVLADPGLHGVTGWTWKTAAAGVVYGVVLAVAGAGIIMPIWLNLLGFGGLPVPNLTGPMLVWHLVYGLVLGTLFAVLAER